jgi:hypothetical protein
LRKSRCLPDGHLANGEPWQLLNGGPITYYSARVFLINRSIATENGMTLPLGFDPA